ncbi:peptidase M16 domain protein [Gloeothece citriformis PCC 7424]|uniref:Peptidase M16 domain protein n=1 Tax=Gloeothece citriformis (strain PCC 7424) TaxID=65393 RepID=B7KGS4_GLOC7|nr:pitrilysin family protein [Gloeothece citriformis]ACK72001.1 peptidase M16 domain protein [Gloeothece citriformis PCC 7424]
MTALLLKTPSLNEPKLVQLPNGLTIVAEQMPVDAVNLNVWLNVGSVRESDAINGMAHFLEHMIFKGTPQLQSGEFERLIEERGAITNAATSQEYTHYYITTAPKDFTQLAPLQFDVVLNPMIPDEAFERERLVVLEEIRRSEDNPRRRTFYRAMETCFETLPYRRPVLGPAQVIENLTPEQMRSFHRYWYQPHSMTATVVGNLPVEQMIDTVAEAFDRAYVPPVESLNFSEHSAPLTPERPFTSIIRREYEDESLHQARLVMAWRVPGLTHLDETYALDVLAVILGQGKVSRLFRDLREDRGLVSHISTSNMTQGVQGLFYISVQLPVANIPVVESAIIDHIRQIRQDSIKETELARIRTQVANRFIFSNERPSDRANLYGYYYSQLQNLDPALSYPQKIQSLDREDIQKAAQRYLSPEAYAIVIMKPTGQ